MVLIVELVFPMVLKTFYWNLWLSYGISMVPLSINDSPCVPLYFLVLFGLAVSYVLACRLADSPCSAVKIITSSCSVVKVDTSTPRHTQRSRSIRHHAQRSRSMSHHSRRSSSIRHHAQHSLLIRHHAQPPRSTSHPAHRSGVGRWSSPICFYDIQCQIEATCWFCNRY